jgi:phosphoglucosamine mutase
MSVRLFGTDGVRGVANKELSADLAFNLGRSAAYILSIKSLKKPKIIIGRDTRISGDMLENALTAGICSAGVDVVKVGVMPTPGIAFLTRDLKAAAGAVISASHNPMEDNGIKFFGPDGYKLSDETEDEIEKMVYKHEEIPCPTGTEVGRVYEMKDAVHKYVEYAKSTVDVSLEGLKVVIDCANGASYKASPCALQDLGVKVIKINSSPDGTNINKDCGSTHIKSLKEAVKKYQAHVGIAHDGDADRIILVDENGETVDGDKIMVACALHMKKQGELKNNTLVVTVMSNLGLHLALKDSGIKILQTKVGDRYVLEKMRETGAVLGGEQSGHILLLEHNTTGDGLITALQILKIMKKSGRKMSQLAALMNTLPQVLKNVKVKNKHEAMKNPKFISAVEKIQKELGGRGRVLVRPSGTEPLVRIMVEGSDEKELKEIAEKLAGFLS